MKKILLIGALAIAGALSISAQVSPRPASQAAVNTGTDRVNFITPATGKGAFANGGAYSNLVVSIASAAVVGGSATNAIPLTNGVGWKTKIIYQTDDGATPMDAALTVERTNVGEAPSRMATLKVANTNMNPGTFGHENEAHIISQVGGGGTNWNARAYWIKRWSTTNDATGWQNEWTFGFNGGNDRTGPGQTILFNDIAGFHHLWIDPTNSPYKGNFEINALQNLAGDGGIVKFNAGSGAEAKAGTNGVRFYSGGASPAIVAAVTGPGDMQARSFGFIGETSTFLTNHAASEVRAVYGGTATWSLSPANMTALNDVNINLGTGGQFTGSRGNTSSPLLAFAQEPDNGIYSALTNSLSVTIAGTERFRVDLSGIHSGGSSNYLGTVNVGSATGTGAGLTNLTYNILTNAINTGVIPVGKTTFTNITGNITIGGFSGVDLNFNQWAKLWATNSTATDYKISLPAAVCTATNGFVIAQDVWVTNKSAVTIAFDIAGFGTNGAAVRFQR